MPNISFPTSKQPISILDLTPDSLAIAGMIYVMSLVSGEGEAIWAGIKSYLFSWLKRDRKTPAGGG